MQTFFTLKAFVMHQKKSKKHVGQTIHLRQLVPTNQCIFCESILGSHAVAFNHVRNALKCGHCSINRGWLPVDLVDMTDIQCPACEYVSPTLPQYYMHIARLHIQPPRVKDQPDTKQHSLLATHFATHNGTYPKRFCHFRSSSQPAAARAKQVSKEDRPGDARAHGVPWG